MYTGPSDFLKQELTICLSEKFHNFSPSRDELNSFTTHNILTDLHVSFSRDEGYPYRYVQHRMAEHGKELLRLIREENAIFYLCGDAKDMAPDVRTAWIEISEKFGGK